MKPIKAIFSWSGGKDSSLCLYFILKQKKYEIISLLTSVNGNNKRVSLHGVHQDLIQAQADVLNLPVKFIYALEGNNEEYEKRMKDALLEFRNKGANTVIFGDIFLEDLRLYREQQLAKINMNAVFPLWKKNTNNLVRKFIDLKFESIVCCINDAYLKQLDVGKKINLKFIKGLPKDVDPCGENGEYHSFCYKAPIFKKSINITQGENIYMPLEKKYQMPDKNSKTTKGFWFCDLHLNTIKHEK